MDTITYRMATVDDIELLTRTRIDFIRDVHKDMTDEQASVLLANNKSYFEKTLRDGTFAAYLAFDGNTLAATSGVNFYNCPPSLKNLTGKTAYISNMYTLPEYRGRGIATRLFDMIVCESRKNGCGFVSLHATDMGRPIYEKYGFSTPNGDMEYVIKGE